MSRGYLDGLHTALASGLRARAVEGTLGPPGYLRIHPRFDRIKDWPWGPNLAVLPRMAPGPQRFHHFAAIGLVATPPADAEFPPLKPLIRWLASNHKRRVGVVAVCVGDDPAPTAELLPSTRSRAGERFHLGIIRLDTTDGRPSNEAARRLLDAPDFDRALRRALLAARILDAG